MSDAHPEDDVFLREAIRLSEQALEDPLSGPFGAVVVKAGQVVGRGRNRVVGLGDPTAHAEMLALRAAAACLETHDLSGCVVYASCEPCPMCLGALYWARVERIVHAGTRADAAEVGFDDVRIYAELERPPDQRDLPLTGRLRTEARRVLRAWHARPDRRTY